MKTKLAVQLFSALLVCGAACFGQDAVVVSTNVTGEVNLPPMPLSRQISSLAALANIKVMFDPRLTQGTNALSTNAVEAINFEGVTPRQVLDAVLQNNNLILVQDPNTGIGRVTIRDPRAAEPVFTRIYQLKNSAPTNMVTILTGAVNNIRVVPNNRTSQLVITATSNDLVAVEALLDELDLATRQVLIEAQLYETLKNPKSIKGIDWSGTLRGQNVTFGNGRTVGETRTATPGGTGTTTTTLPSGRVISTTTTQPQSVATTMSTIFGAGISDLSLDTARGFHPSTAFLNADGVRAVLSFLNEDSDTELISTPRTVTLDNQPAVLNVSVSYPIFQTTPGSANTPAATQITYTNVGTILTVTPRISADDQVTLKVVPEVSGIGVPNTQIINGQENQANTYTLSKVETQVVIPSGNTLVMGGLMSHKTIKAYTKVPILGDLPGIGLAFRRESKERQKQNLIIFVTPHILREDDFQPSESNFLKTRRVEKPEAVDSAWDSGKPHDWSKPID